MLKDILIDFGIPAILIVGCFTLLILGIDGEVKTILVMAAGWCFHSGYTRVKGVK
ncbi:hypothetical protein ES708_34636 [subsurface metagenome]